MPCLDCHCPDQYMPMDTVLTLRQWQMICPEDGMLCISCIYRRVLRIPEAMGLILHIEVH